MPTQSSIKSLKARSNSIVNREKDLLNSLINFTGEIFTIRRQLPPFYELKLYIKEEYLPRMLHAICAHPSPQEYARAVIEGLKKFLNWQYVYFHNIQLLSIDPQHRPLFEAIEGKISALNKIFEDAGVFDKDESYIKKVYALDSLSTITSIRNHEHVIESDPLDSPTIPVVDAPPIVSFLAPKVSCDIPPDLKVEYLHSLDSIQKELNENNLLILMDRNKQVIWSEQSNHNITPEEITKSLKLHHGSYASLLKSNVDMHTITESLYYLQPKSLSRRECLLKIKKFNPLSKKHADLVENFKADRIKSQQQLTELRELITNSQKTDKKSTITDIENIITALTEKVGISRKSV